MIQIGKTLYITTENSYLHCDDSTITIKLPNGVQQCLSYDVVSEIIIFTNITLTCYLVNQCSQHGIIIDCISPYGKYLGKFVGNHTGNVMLRKCQFDIINSLKSVNYVRNVIACKIHNSINFLKYMKKNIVQKDFIETAIDRLRKGMSNIKCSSDIDDMRLIEANMAAVYYSTFDLLVKSTDATMQFESRSKRPPLNRFNSLLSLFYTITTSICTSALTVRGLDSECGYLHALRSGRNSLSCDLVEEFRTCIVDRFVITLVNRCEVVSSDFEIDASGIRLKHDAHKKLLSKWESYLNNTIVIHKLYNKKMSLKLVIYEQALLLSQYIRGDIDEYPPFLMEY